MNNLELDELSCITQSLSGLRKAIQDPNFFIAPFDKSEKQHSKQIDRMLGFRTSKIEQRLLRKYRAYYKNSDESNRKKHFEGTQTWIGLHPQVLQTPYSQIAHFLSYLKKHNPKKVVDLGAAYGRVGIVMNAVLPKTSFLGFEILNDRLKEANRMFDLLNLTNCQMSDRNILEDSFEIPKADAYFIYDFSDPQDLKVILEKLSEKLFEERFFIIARGQGVRSLIQLKYPQFWAVHGVIHKKEWSLYSSFCDL